MVRFGKICTPISQKGVINEDYVIKVLSLKDMESIPGVYVMMEPSKERAIIVENG